MDQRKYKKPFFKMSGRRWTTDTFGVLSRIQPYPAEAFSHRYKNHFLGILPEEKLVVVYRSEDKQGVKYNAADMRKILFMIYSAKN